MSFYQKIGDVPLKRHTQHSRPDGGLYYEELIGEEGFTGSSSLLYHKNIPSAMIEFKPWKEASGSLAPNYPLKPRHFRLHELFGAEILKETDIITGRRLILGNGDVRISYVAAGKPSPLYRNATGDECVYIEAGSGEVETIFGIVPFRQGDYVVIPRATTMRWIPAPREAVLAYCIEANSHVFPAARYLSKYGQLLEHAPFCERDLHGPIEPFVVDSDEVEILVKHHDGSGGIVGTRVLAEKHPFDVIGWDGYLYPYTFNISDFEPLTGRIHQPPPTHQVFEGNGFVICNFVPRKVDYHPLSIPVPYYHSNVDSDEVMFYCGGNYEARRGSGIEQGSVSLHPGGHVHGPQPGAYERSIGIEFFDELAVMIDTFRPLRLGEGAQEVEDTAYATTWLHRGS